jgi:hypothetical protein
MGPGPRGSSAGASGTAQSGMDGRRGWTRCARPGLPTLGFLINGRYRPRHAKPCHCWIHHTPRGARPWPWCARAGSHEAPSCAPLDNRQADKARAQPPRGQASGGEAPSPPSPSAHHNDDDHPSLSKPRHEVPVGLAYRCHRSTSCDRGNTEQLVVEIGTNRDLDRATASTNTASGGGDPCHAPARGVAIAVAASRPRDQLLHGAPTQRRARRLPPIRQGVISGAR